MQDLWNYWEQIVKSVNATRFIQIVANRPLLISFLFITERCHEEIVRVLGYDRLPSMEDRDKLPYTHATVHEIQRCANIAPAGVFHETTQPTKLWGYDISQVMNGA